MVAPIDMNTFVTKGMPITDNFLLDHLSTGAYHYVMGKWAPQFSSVIRPNASQSIPLWQLAQNIQNGTQGILEPMLREFGGDMIIRTGFDPSSLGQSFDIQIAGFQGNMFNLMPDIQKIANKAQSIALVQGTTSFARISFDASSINTAIRLDLPQLVTIDLINNVTTKDLISVRGFI